MAGGKETPRQKMIGMMYLVLTALLALQVNSAILLKFKFIDDSLLSVNDKTSVAADGTIKGIQAAVVKNQNQARDKAVLAQSEEIRQKTKDVVSYLRGVREQLLKATENTSTEITNMSGEDKVAITMLGGKKNGIAYTTMKPKLNEYAQYMKQFLPDATPLALDGKEDNRVTKDQRTKNFAELNFENTPVVAALATISQKETEILKMEADALQKQAEKVGA
ncbi:MAG TPA: gliding motility protein GldM, partial [Hymenobacter sp.]